MAKEVLMRRYLAGSMMAVALWSVQSDAALIYSNNFDTPAFKAAGVSASLTGGFVGAVSAGPYAGSLGKSWAGNYFNGNGASATLTLTGLPVHTGVNVDLLLGFLNSWDSRNGTVARDDLNLYIDGRLLLSMTTNNASGTVVDFDGGTLLVNDGQIDSNRFFSDDLVDMATASLLTLAHTAPSLTLRITPTGRGWQGWPDEGWGMDALRVSVTGDESTHGVPVGPTLSLFGIGLAGLGLARWHGARRRG